MFLSSGHPKSLVPRLRSSGSIGRRFLWPYNPNENMKNGKHFQHTIFMLYLCES